MIICNQCCRYNSGNRGCSRPINEPCMLSNVREDSNADHIRAMNDDELAKTIQQFQLAALNELLKALNKPLKANEYDEDFQLILDWLKQPWEDKQND